MLSEFPEKASSLLLLCSAAGSCSRPAAAAYGRLRNITPCRRRTGSFRNALPEKDATTGRRYGEFEKTGKFVNFKTGRHRTAALKRARPRGGKGGFPLRFGGVSCTIRILLYLDVSCVLYPVEYMYPECILMYLKCILNALLHSNRIHVS